MDQRNDQRNGRFCETENRTDVKAVEKRRCLNLFGTVAARAQHSGCDDNFERLYDETSASLDGKRKLPLGSGHSIAVVGVRVFYGCASRKDVDFPTHERSVEPLESRGETSWTRDGKPQQKARSGRQGRQDFKGFVKRSVRHSNGEKTRCRQKLDLQVSFPV